MILFRRIIIKFLRNIIKLKNPYLEINYGTISIEGITQNYNLVRLEEEVVKLSRII